jgi:hypothetical protein
VLPTVSATNESDPSVIDIPLTSKNIKQTCTWGGTPPVALAALFSSGKPSLLLLLPAPAEAAARGGHAAMSATKSTNDVNSQPTQAAKHILIDNYHDSNATATHPRFEQ